MLTIIVGTDTNTRTKKREDVLKKHSSETIILDDTLSSVLELEQYIYPSLFSLSDSVVHARYLIEEYTDQVTKDLLQKLITSPTIFILEERVLALPLIKTIEKEGGVVFHDKGVKQPSKPNTIFAVTNALTAVSKKERWLAYRNARTEHPAEALIGILYWKLRDLIEKKGDKVSVYKKIYTSLIKAHKQSWQKGFALDVAIEKVLLEN